ncbi:MAG: rod shape-determining protein MreC [Patescibacteria group bacterium]
MASSSRNLLWAIVGGCVFTLLLFFHTLDLLLQPLQRALDPLERFFMLRSQTVQQWFEDRNAVIQERDALRSTLQGFYQQVQDAESCMQENAELSELLGIHTTYRIEQVAAKIVNYANLSRTRITIDKGLREGVTKGDAVVVGSGIIIGKVVDATNERATVALLTDADVSLAATLAGSTNEEGIVRSRRGALMLDFIPQGMELPVGHLVVTAGSDERIPRNFTIGYVTALVTDKSAPFQSALIEQSISIADYAFVSVLKGNQ